MKMIKLSLKRMRIPCSLTSIILHLFPLFSTVILFPPVSTNAFNITKVLKRYEDCYKFNDILSETNVANKINRLRPPITVLAVESYNLHLNEMLAPCVWEQIISRHIILDKIDNFALNSTEPKDLRSYPTMSKDTMIHINRENDGSTDYFIVTFEKYEGKDVQKSGSTMVVSTKSFLGGGYSVLVVESLLLDPSEEALNITCDPNAIVDAPTMPPEAGPPEPFQNSNQETDTDFEVSKNNASTSMTPPQIIRYPSTISSSGTDLIATTRRNGVFGILVGFLILGNIGFGLK